MLGRQEHRRTAEDRIHARRKDPNRLVESLHRKVHERAGGLADPILLHRDDALGPAHQLFHVVQERVGVGGNFPEPLLELALLDRRLLVPPAAAIDHLLVREHGLALRAPVHAALLAVGESALVHLEEEPLVPAVVFGRAGSDLAPPIVAEAQAL